MNSAILYTRFFPAIGKTISFRHVSFEDFPLLHQWHSSPRVSHYWNLNKTEEEFARHMADELRDPHQILLMMEVDGVPAGYFDVYWVKEDTLGSYYEAEAFDRGFHFLIAKEFLGAKNTDTFVKAILHFIYLDEARTQRVMVEPRADNVKVLKYARSATGWKKVKEFNSPQGKSVLLQNSRELFFECLNFLHPVNSSTL